MIGFLAKRVALLALPGAVLSVILTRDAGFGAGLLLGAFLGVYKLRVSRQLLAASVAASSPRARTLVLQMLSQLLVFALLLLTILVDFALFGGFALGVLLLPLVICINAVSERLGLSKNQWGEQESNL